MRLLCSGSLWLSLCSDGNNAPSSIIHIHTVGVIREAFHGHSQLNPSRLFYCVYPIVKPVHVDTNANDVHLAKGIRSQFRGWEGRTGWGWMEVAHVIVHFNCTTAENKRLFFVKKKNDVCLCIHLKTIRDISVLGTITLDTDIYDPKRFIWVGEVRSFITATSAGVGQPQGIGASGIFQPGVQASRGREFAFVLWLWQGRGGVWGCKATHTHTH